MQVALVAAAARLVHDGPGEVRLAEADAAVDEQGIVAAAGVLRHPLGRGVSEPVAGPDQESVEGVPAIELRGARPLAQKLRRGWWLNWPKVSVTLAQMDLELHRQWAPGDAADGLLDEGVKALLQRLGNKGTGHAHYEAAVALRQPHCVPQPGIVVGGADLALEFLKC